MNEPKPAAPPRRKGKDRWGLRPVRRGRVRGQIRNVRRSFEVGDFGTLRVIDFDLFIDDDLPPVPVRMAGTDFNREPPEGGIVEVRDPDPSVRPIAARLLEFPPHYDGDVRSFYPGRDDPPPSRERVHAILMVLGPIIAVAAAVGLFAALHG